MTELVVFDLDGTLLDSHGDIHRCILMALHECGKQEISYDQVASYLGAPLHVYHEELRPPVDYAEFLAVYRRFQDEHGLDTTRLFDGVIETLEVLGDVPLAIASTKPTHRVRQHAEAFGLAGFFQHLQGSDDPPYKPDPAVLLRVLDHMPADPTRSWMVGDLVTDVQAGNAIGMRTLGVTYAGTPREAHARAGATAIADSVEEVREILVGDE